MTPNLLINTPEGRGLTAKGGRDDAPRLRA